MGNLNFDSSKTEPTSMDFSPLPPGKYLAHVSASEVVETSKGGEMLKLTIVIDDELFKNRQVWTNLNIVNDSEKAQQIALGMLSALCRAIGKVGIVSDSSQLHDKKFLVGLGIDPGNVQYPEPRNKVTGFFPVEKNGKATKNLKAAKEAVENPAEETEEELPDFLK